MLYVVAMRWLYRQQCCCAALHDYRKKLYAARPRYNRQTLCKCNHAPCHISDFLGGKTTKFNLFFGSSALTQAVRYAYFVAISVVKISASRGAPCCGNSLAWSMKDIGQPACAAFLSAQL